MNEQSGHLSDAQIENYGEPGSSAGPEAVVVEEHLDECPACRERLLTFHRGQMGLLAESGMAGSNLAVPSGIPELSGTNSLGRQNVKTAPTSACPNESDLRDLAAGVCPEAKASGLTQHTATCDRCGALLRAYAEDFSEDLSEEEEALLQKTKGALPEWHKQTARKVMKAEQLKADELDADVQFQGKAVPSRADEAIEETKVRTFSKTSGTSGSGRREKPSFSWKWVLIPATAAACGLIALGIWYQRRDTPEKVEKLLAQAYTEQRTMEMMIPYATHSDLKQVRSGENTSVLNSPEPMRKAAERIARSLKQNPGDASWLMLSARLDLLDWRYSSALATLNTINDAKIIDSPEYRMTQALAFYQKAEIEHDAQSYGQVIDLTRDTLEKIPDDPIALFNQAVACEKLYLYECSISDYERYLKIDSASGWAGETREHLKRIQEKKTSAH